jgi:hypothetical protein
VEYEDYQTDNQTNVLAYESAAETISAEQKKAKANEWRESPKWLAIRGITKPDLLNGTGQIEKLKYPPWDKRNTNQPTEPLSCNIGYGKYHDKTYEWVKQNDFRYFSWCSENIPKFAAKVRQLGL